MALTVYTRHSHYLINNVTRTQLWTAGMSDSLVQRRMMDKANELVGNYLDNRAKGTKALPLPMATCARCARGGRSPTRVRRWQRSPS